MHHRHDAGGATHQRERVVLNIMMPIVVRNAAVHLRKIAAKKADHIQHVYALIEQDTSASNRTLRPPPSGERDDRPLSVNTSDVHDITIAATIHNRLRLTD